MLAVLTFATEGDNVTDAEQLCDALRQHITAGEAWKAPISWGSVYGKARDMSAY